MCYRVAYRKQIMCMTYRASGTQGMKIIFDDIQGIASI
jgi:hypothetical protein